MTRPAIALSIAGSDPSGGAGLQADLKTFSALGVYGAAIPAALTAQNTRGVTAMLALPGAFVAAQIQAILNDLPVDAVKLGMLQSAEVISAVADALAGAPSLPVVLDPVMVSKSGAALLDPTAVDALRTMLIPRATLLTPNLPEAAALLGEREVDLLPSPPSSTDVLRVCQRLAGLGAGCVLLKGGHIAPDGERSDDYFWDGAMLCRLAGVRIASRNTHGTGCTYSAAIAALWARGLRGLDAVRAARSYVQGAIVASADWRVGDGAGPLHHFHSVWPLLPLPPPAACESLVSAASPPPLLPTAPPRRN